MVNKFKEQKSNEAQSEHIAQSKESKVVRSVANVVSGSFLTREKSLKKLPFVFFLSLLSVCYIANGYYADDQVRKVNRLVSEIRELRTQYILVKDSLVIKSKQTEVARSLAKQQSGIKESVVPPKKIVVSEVVSEVKMD